MKKGKAMDRLTYRDRDYQAVLLGDLGTSSTLTAAVEKLAAYEDTGLSPGEIDERNAEEEGWREKYDRLKEETESLRTEVEYRRLQQNDMMEEITFLRGVQQTVEVIYGRKFNERG